MNTPQTARPDPVSSFRFRDGIRWNGARFEDPPAVMFEVAATLLGWGGEEVVWMGTDEFLLETFAERGGFVSGEGSRLELGEPSQCHFNSALRLSRPGWQVGTGWALSEDGLWRPHSWNIAADGTVVESTVPRVGYGGVVLSAEESLVFAFNEGVGAEVISADTGRWLEVAQRLSQRAESLGVQEQEPTRSAWALVKRSEQQS